MVVGWDWEGGGGGLARGDLTDLVCPCTEEEKAEARKFEEDQVAGRLKEDVVSCGGKVVGEKGSGRSCSRELTPLFSVQLEQRGRLQKSVAKEVSGQGALV